MSVRSSVLHDALAKACEGTSVSTKELLRELSAEDVTSILEEDFLMDDLRTLALELADDKDNQMIYRAFARSNESFEYLD